ncbi:MAG: class I SAM-dependent methyltransferase [Candidatus Geothermarchaeota archaeon]
MIRVKLIRSILRLIHKIVPKVIRFYKFYGIKLYVPYGVFNPILTVSTSLILKNLKVCGKVIDIGCGTGVIAIYSSLNECVEEAYAYDVSLKALATAKVNIKLNGVSNKVRIIFNKEELCELSFDYIIVNPPYLPIEPSDELDTLWCGGKDLRIYSSILKLAYSILRRGGSIILTASSVSDMNLVMKIIRNLNLKIRSLKYAVTPLDKIYLINAQKL